MLNPPKKGFSGFFHDHHGGAGNVGISYGTRIVYEVLGYTKSVLPIHTSLSTPPAVGFSEGLQIP